MFPRQSLCLLETGGWSQLLLQTALLLTTWALLSFEPGEAGLRHLEFGPFLKQAGVSPRLTHSQGQSPKCERGFS